MIRGKRHTEGRASQSRDYSGLSYGTITPTDIDAVIEYKDKGYVLFEIKLIDAVMGLGQKLALERMCDDLSKRKESLLIVVSHNTPVETAIDLANCNVEKYRYRGKWFPDKRRTKYIGQPVKLLVDYFINMLDGKIRVEA